LHLPRPHRYYGPWSFQEALGELRSLFGVHIGQLAVEHGLDLDDQLAVILPPALQDEA
jgi:hypothetical protein